VRCIASISLLPLAKTAREGASAAQACSGLLYTNTIRSLQPERLSAATPMSLILKLRLRRRLYGHYGLAL